MECEECHQVSDWIGVDSRWRRVNPGSAADAPLYECADCGNHQRAR